MLNKLRELGIDYVEGRFQAQDLHDDDIED